MGISTVSVGAAVAPTVVDTWFSHYLNRKPRKQKPTAHISYDVGLTLLRRFLAFAGTQTIEDVQAFTAQQSPIPHWVKVEELLVPIEHVKQAALHLQDELGPEGIYAVGGRTWWQWRQEDNPLRAEWIEMDKDHQLRKRRKTTCQRSMLYLPGGAYYFGGVDAHRYQIQRHARKLQARCLAPRYRLAPQFPFPCGLLDCLAAYLYLLTQQEPETIVFAGDSAGGGMVLSLLVLLRDQGLPMPAGAILLSPWVDLTHSFPSVAGAHALDYVPSDGFHHKPSMCWPPPGADALAALDDVLIEMEHGKRIPARALREQVRERVEKGKAREPAETDVQADGTDAQRKANTDQHEGIGKPTNLFCNMDGKNVEIKEQIQFFATNELLAYPLVSPIMQASLGGLPPLCILTGGGEMLRDEQIYLAHKAANPLGYPPPTVEDYPQGGTPHPHLKDRATINTAIARYPPTYVQLQVWDDLCHVATTLSWTRPAKYMYRSIAQFGAWAYARAQMSEIRILDDDEISIISSQSSESLDSDDPSAHSRSSTDTRRKRRMSKDTQRPARNDKPIHSGLHRPTTPVAVGRAGDPLPLFKDHMIRQRVTRHGDVYALDPPSMLEATTMPITEIGVIKQGPVKKWMEVQKMLDSRFGDIKREVQNKRLQELTETTGGRGMVFTAGREDGMLIGEEHPPATALACRTTKQLKAMGMLKKQKDKMSKGLSMWSGWGSKHDEDAIDKEDEKIKQKADVTMAVVNVRRRQSMNLLGTGPIAGGGLLGEEMQQSSSVPEGQQYAVEATTGRESLPAVQSETAKSAATPHTTRLSHTKPSPIAPDTKPPQEAPVDSPLEPERTVSASQHPILADREGMTPPATVPFKLARPENLKMAQASTLTLDEADGAILPDSATLPPPGFNAHHSIASTLYPDDTKRPGAHQKKGSVEVPTAAAAASAGGTFLTNHSNHGSTADISRPSTADVNASRPISPYGESISESIDVAQPAQAQAVRISHARASSKGNIDAAAMAQLANIDKERPPMPNGNGLVDSRPSLESAVTPKGITPQMPVGIGSVPTPDVGALHGAEKTTYGELKSAQEDSHNWASGVLKDVEQAGSRTASRDGDTATERLGKGQSSTADQI